MWRIFVTNCFWRFLLTYNLLTNALGSEYLRSCFLFICYKTKLSYDLGLNKAETILSLFCSTGVQAYNGTTKFRSSWRNFVIHSYLATEEDTYTVLHIFRQVLFGAGNQGNPKISKNPNFDILMGMKQKYFFWKKKILNWPILNFFFRENFMDWSFG